MRTVEDLSVALGLGTCCGRCRDCAADVLAEVHGARAAPVAGERAEVALLSGDD
jgi:bacterioferritin-associated ferredoxin